MPLREERFPGREIMIFAVMDNMMEKEIALSLKNTYSSIISGSRGWENLAYHLLRKTRSGNQRSDGPIGYMDFGVMISVMNLSLRTSSTAGYWVTPGSPPFEVRISKTIPGFFL